ncbi:PP2C family serine/threonine-protein phosphatase [Pontibacter sp. SGAir0037]|uniref:PP2C family protein-serine/threonine phosphatase n=1 Tax=Pontibacter sp. SGAir0037 TaxID=2571030 RepID=UPI0010CD3A25|nr:protein phosphatase 2C domain-containing protein [Pontibacter sp. SGAir0037]QCR21554.1 serine/threonine-protein phosphatase [Pontibacter sp. SGAir0037]
MPLPNKVYTLHEIGGRKNNEDAVWPAPGDGPYPDNPLFMVCDGVGGNSHGEVASEFACRYISEYFNKNLKSEDQLNVGFLEQAREFAMEKFRQYIAENPEAERMSTTLTLAYLKKDSVFLAWCGDSKIFQLRNGNVIYQSEDHSLVNELVKRGEITPEEAVTHPQRNIITRSLQATEPYSEMQTAELTDVKEHDYILLCSDGVTENITPAKLKFILASEPEEDLLEQFQQYCYGKTRDNYSMQLIQLSFSRAAVPGTAPVKKEGGFKAFIKRLVS